MAKIPDSDLDLPWPCSAEEYQARMHDAVEPSPRAESTEHPTPETSATGLAAMEARLLKAEQDLDRERARAKRLGVVELVLAHRIGRLAVLLAMLLGPTGVAVGSFTLADRVDALGKQQRETDRLLLIFSEALVLSLEHDHDVASAVAAGLAAPRPPERLEKLRKLLEAAQLNRELAE